MTTTWTVACKGCGRKVVYSEAARRAALDRGQSPPERCADCKGTHRRETSRLGLAYLDLEPGRPVPASGLKAGRLGRIERPKRPHTSRKTDPQPVGEDDFGIKDEHVRELLNGLKTHQVGIVQAGTGSGKSTFLPWRLLVPPEPFERDHLTRHGQIVVTQPRIDASTGIPEYVAERLHGSKAGPGLDIGYRNSKAADKSDAANRLVYLTDGTLVNMIRRGEMHTVSTVVIDEAHERSLNIDLILALLRRELRNLPHMRLLIVSATLDRQTFSDFFAPDYDVLFCPMPSKTVHPVYERWRAEEPIPFASWSRQMPIEVAQRAVEVLRWMALSDAPADIPGSVPCYNGDILCFLPGKRPIAQAIDRITELINDDDALGKLAHQIEILPLHAELPAGQRRRPLERTSRAKHVRWRVIVSTNLAETSLTIDGIRHVIDSGLNNLTSWDPHTAAAEIRPAPHSQSGLLQRRGRAGRNAPGVWHCLFTKEQFEQLEYATAPEISRAPLSAVLLSATNAGVSDPGSLRWLPPGPPTAELARARAELRALGAITDAGDPTSFGREISASRGEFSDSTILINADLAGCAVEAATVLAMKAKALAKHSLLRWNTGWPAAAKVHVDDVHSALLQRCPDDVEAICRIVAYYEQLPPGRHQLWCERHYIDHQVLQTLLRERSSLLTGLQSKMTTEEIRPVDLALLPRLRAMIAWSSPNGVYATEPSTDGGLRLVPVQTARSDPEVIAAMHNGARPVVDPRSWAYRQGPKYLVMLDRSRKSLWTSPLGAPETVQQGALCAAVDPAVLKATGSLLGVLVDVGTGERPAPPGFLPGDRFRAYVDGWTVQLIDMLQPMPDPTIELGTDDDDQDTPDEWEETSVNSDRPTRAGADQEEAGEADYAYVGAYQEDPLSGPEGGAGADNRPPLPAPTLPVAELDVYCNRRGEEPVRVVAEHDGVVHVVPDRAKEELRECEAAHPVGSDFAAEIEEIRIFPRDLQPLLLARDRTTRQIIVLDGGQLGTGLRYTQTGQLLPGTTLHLTAEGYDYERLTAYYGQTKATISALTSLTMLSGTARRAAVVTAMLVEAADGKLWVQILPDALNKLRPETPPIVLTIDSGRLPAMPGLVVGATVHARIFWGRATSWSQKVPGLDMAGQRLPPGPWEVQGEQIVVSAPPAVADWERILEFTQSLRDQALAARLRSAFAWAARRILTPRFEVIDQVAIEKMRDEGRADGVVTSADERGVTVRLPHGGTQRVPAAQTSWDGIHRGYQVGEKVTAFVTTAEPETCEVRVQLRDPQLNPLLGLSEGEIVEAAVMARQERDQRNFTVYLPDANAHGLLRGYNAAEAGVSDMLLVRVIEVRPVDDFAEVSAWLVDESIPLPDHLEPLWRSSDGKIDRRAFTRLVSEDVRLDIRDGEEPHIRVRSTDESSGTTATADLTAVLCGDLYYIAIPEFSVVNADQSALLWEFAPEAAIATCRYQADGRMVPALAVATDSAEVVGWIVDRLREVYPQQWVSDWFRFKSAQWKAATAELRASGLQVRASLEKDDAYFQAVLSGEESQFDEALDLMRQHLAIPSDGSFRTDERIWIIE